MKKIVSALAVSITLMAVGIAAPRAALANSQGNVRVAGVGVHWNNTGYAYLEGVAECGIFYNSITDERWKYFHAMMMAARLSQRALARVDYDVTDAAARQCTLTLVQF